MRAGLIMPTGVRLERAWYDQLLMLCFSFWSEYLASLVGVTTYPKGWKGHKALPTCNPRGLRKGFNVTFLGDTLHLCCSGLTIELSSTRCHRAV